MKHIFAILVTMLFTQSLISQCEPDRHSTDAIDGWISCVPRDNPNSNRGVGHWIHYDFGSVRTIYDLHFWNINHPTYLDDGIRNFIIDISMDGNSWTTVDSFTLSRASGSAFYAGMRGPDLGGMPARHMLLTAVDNHGGGCFGLGEIKIYTDDYEPAEFLFEMKICEHDGLYRNLSSGLGTGAYSGRGVLDNGDGTFDFDASLAGPGLHEIVQSNGGGDLTGMLEVLPCQTDICGGCLECPSYLQADLNGTPIPPGTYQGFELTSEGTVTSDQVILWGGQTAALYPEFEVSASGLLEVDIRTCYDNMLLNGGFEDGVSAWNFSQGNGAMGSWTTVSEAYEGQSAAAVSVTQAGTSSSNISLHYRDLSIEAGKRYRVSIVARADDDKVMTLRIQGESAPYTGYINVDLSLKPHWQVFSYEFDATETRIEDIRLHLRCGLETGTYVFDRVLWTVVE